MKTLPWILVVVLSVVLLFSLFHSKKQQIEYKTSDTVMTIDTIRDTIPRVTLVRFDQWDTIYIPLLIDSEVVDSVPFAIEIEKKEYRTEDYHAIISGYKPTLDLIEVFQKTQTITLTPKPKKWGLGLHAGYGYPGGWHVGVGISYNLISW